jgi:hypothetical protein
MGAMTNFPIIHARHTDGIVSGRFGGAMSIADDLATILLELVQLRKD